MSKTGLTQNKSSHDRHINVKLSDRCIVKDQYINQLQAEVNGYAAERDETMEAIVLAANGRGGAARATSTDDSDGVASYTDGGGNIVDNDAQKLEEAEGGSIKVTRLLGGVAALDGAGGAVAGWLVSATSGSGNRDGGDGRSEEESGLEEHGVI
jgi:hypothetical protein